MESGLLRARCCCCRHPGASVLAAGTLRSEPRPPLCSLRASPQISSERAPSRALRGAGVTGLGLRGSWAGTRSPHAGSDQGPSHKSSRLRSRLSGSRGVSGRETGGLVLRRHLALHTTLKRKFLHFPRADGGHGLHGCRRVYRSGQGRSHRRRVWSQKLRIFFMFTGAAAPQRVSPSGTRRLGGTQSRRRAGLLEGSAQLLSRRESPGRVRERAPGFREARAAGSCRLRLSELI